MQKKSLLIIFFFLFYLFNAIFGPLTISVLKGRSARISNIKYEKEKEGIKSDKKDEKRKMRSAEAVSVALPAIYTLKYRNTSFLNPAVLKRW
jgi:hypothetical protein